MSSLFLTAIFAAVLAQGGQTAPPPNCSGAPHRQFDFWIGTWDVVSNPQAPPSALQISGTNIISAEYDGCVIVERWQGSGFTGSSYNVYDRTRGEWHQTWVDSSGGLHHYRGGLKDGHMILHGETPLPGGARFAGRRTIRLTYSPLGADKMRQLGEALMADGSWTVSYDLIYSRKKTKTQ